MTYTPLTKRPKDITAMTFVEPLGPENVHVVIGLYDNRPIEVFAYYKRSGSDEVAMVEGLTRMVSIALKAGVDPQHIIKQLRGIKGSTISLREGGANYSVPDIIAKVLTETMESVGAITMGVRGFDGTEKPHVGTVPDGEFDSPPPPPKDIAIVAIEPLCPECSSQLVFQEGCQKCYSCGYSKC